MSKYSELANMLEDNPTIDVLAMELFDSAAAALRELEAERDRLLEAFYFAWSRRPLLGKQWDGESDPLPLVLAAMDEERTALEGK